MGVGFNENFNSIFLMWVLRLKETLGVGFKGNLYPIYFLWVLDLIFLSNYSVVLISGHEVLL